VSLVVDASKRGDQKMKRPGNKRKERRTVVCLRLGPLELAVEEEEREQIPPDGGIEMVEWCAVFISAQLLYIFSIQIWYTKI